MDTDWVTLGYHFLDVGPWGALFQPQDPRASTSLYANRDLLITS